ncbi:unnamed protein product [Caenorhabditis angaria]|uniref:Palmitoyltransferase n=1 Tax=Caenorhabditis angaria TaxID=860376 RepID=A0A9P1IF99_9PELO|nr:unnamed protein product [Caenorhabditis angaria]
MECLAVFNNCAKKCVKKCAALETDKSASKWLSRCFIGFFSLVASVFAYGALFKIIPYEISVAPSYFSIFWRLLMFVYLFYTIIFHYSQCISNEPIKVPQLGREGKYCHKCDIVKCAQTHHCPVCDKCIYQLDHHCPWIGQCVGAHNQSNFASFLSFMSLACICFFALASSFWIAHFKELQLDISSLLKNLQQSSILSKNDAEMVLRNSILYLNPIFIVFFSGCSGKGYEITVLFGFFFVIFFLFFVFWVAQMWKIANGTFTLNGEMLKKSGEKLNFQTISHRFRKYYGMFYKAGNGKSEEMVKNDLKTWKTSNFRVI